MSLGWCSALQNGHLACCNCIVCALSLYGAHMIYCSAFSHDFESSVTTCYFLGWDLVLVGLAGLLLVPWCCIGLMDDDNITDALDFCLGGNLNSCWSGAWRWPVGLLVFPVLVGCFCWFGLYGLLLLLNNKLIIILIWCDDSLGRDSLWCGSCW